jgi:hypothetical protein
MVFTVLLVVQEIRRGPDMRMVKEALSREDLEATEAALGDGMKASLLFPVFSSPPRVSKKNSSCAQLKFVSCGQDSAGTSFSDLEFEGVMYRFAMYFFSVCTVHWTIEQFIQLRKLTENKWERGRCDWIAQSKVAWSLPLTYFLM